MAITAQNGLHPTLCSAPHLGRVASERVVALDAGVKRGAALELDANQVALGVIVGALGALVHANAAAG